MQSAGGDELPHGSWELSAPNLGPPDSSFLEPRSAFTEGGSAYIQEAGGAGDGGTFLDLAHAAGLFGLMDSNADSSMFFGSKPASDLRVQQSTQYKQGSVEERRQLSSAAQPPQPPRRASQQSYSVATSRQLSRSVPSSPTFATSRLHMNSAMAGGGGSGATAPAGLGNRLPMLAKSLSVHMLPGQQVSSSASVLTASLDLASCTANLLPPSPGSFRSATFTSDHATPARSSNFSGDHATKSSNFSSDQSATASPTSFTTDHPARSANFCTDRPPNFSSDQASRPGNFSSELAAAASLFLPFFPTTPASSTAGLNLAGEGQDHYVQAPAGSGATNNQLAKRRRVQGSKSKSPSKLAATEDTSADHVLPLNQGGVNVEMAQVEPAMSNNSASNEEDFGMKGNANSTTSSTIKTTQDNDDPPSAPPPPPPPKQDYIHVRARRGQATDSHSLAERVRREKISERMKCLQDLVPGCNKITGKALMLDEIINYVQSLQRQVEFLSMKLSAISPQTSTFEASHLINHAESKSMQSNTTLQFNQTNDHPHLHHDLHLSMPLLLDVQQAPQHHQQPSNMGAKAWEDELQNLVQMGFPTIP